MSLSHSGAFLAFRYRDFSLLSLNQLCLCLAVLIQEVAISYSLYQLTQNPLSLGLAALAELIPFICLSLLGGHWADRFNRQKILQWSFSCSAAIPLLFIALFHAYQQQAIPQSALLLGIYSLMFCLGILRGIYSPSFNSLRPFLVPEHAYANASAWTSMIWQIGAIAGPVCAGLLFSQFGLASALFFAFILCCIGSIALYALSPREFPKASAQRMAESLKEALLFIFRHRLMFWAILLDLALMLFCGVAILLPVFAEDILHTGAEGLGILRAAPAAGSCLMMLCLTLVSPMRHAWRNMLMASLGIACCTLAFALSPFFWLSAALLAAAGALDSISMVIRQTLFQQLPPKALLGRVAALNGILVTSGNQFGALHASFMARYFTAVPAVLIGGGICLLISGASLMRTRDLLKAPDSHDRYALPAAGASHADKD